MRPMRLLTTALCAALALPLSACAATEESILDKDVLRVGVRYDLPLISQEVDGELQGFEIDIARYIADHLGADVEFVPLSAAEREPFLLDDHIDIAVATYSITQERKQTIDFAGPFVIEHFNVMVRSGENTIAAVGDLEGRTVCEVAGSNVVDRILIEHGVDADVFEVDDYDQCMDALEEGRVDAVTTDEFILAGLKNSRPDLDLEILDARYSRERVGVGMQPGDTAGCEAINRAITDMHADGTIDLLLRVWFAPSGLDVADPPIPQFEGCE